MSTQEITTKLTLPGHRVHQPFFFGSSRISSSTNAEGDHIRRASLDGSHRMTELLLMLASTVDPDFEISDEQTLRARRRSQSLPQSLRQRPWIPEDSEYRGTLHSSLLGNEGLLCSSGSASVPTSILQDASESEELHEEYHDPQTYAPFERTEP